MCPSQQPCNPCASLFTHLESWHSLQLTLLPTVHTGLCLEQPSCLSARGPTISRVFPFLSQNEHKGFQLLPVLTQKCFLCCAMSSWPRPRALSMQLTEAGEARVFGWYWGANCKATFVQEPPHSPQPAMSVLRICLLAPSIRRDCGHDSVCVSH